MQAERIRVREGASDELAVIAQRAQAFTNASGTAIALSEGNAAEIICRARAGSSAPPVGTPLRVEGTFTGLCIQSGKELRCDDAETDTRVDKAAIRALGIRSMVAIPIKDQGRVVGVLAAFAPTAHAFKITHVAVLKTMADQIAAYLHRTQREDAYFLQSQPAPPEKALAGSATAAPAPPRAPVIKPAAIKPAAPPPRPQQRPVVPKVEPVQGRPLAEQTGPAPFGKKKKANSHAEQKAKTDSRPMFRALAAAAMPETRPGAKVLMIGAAALVVIAGVALSFKLRRPVGVPQPVVETASSPANIPAAPAPASANVQPLAKNVPPAPAAKHDEAPKREEALPQREATVVLSPRPSRISGAGDNSGATSVAPAIFLGSVSASGTLSNLVSPVSQLPHPRLLTQSQLEPVTVIKKVPPVYPLAAKQSRLTGSVVVQGTVNKDGRIRDLQLISGPPLFRDAAFAAVKQWVFKPARLNGQAIEQLTQIRLHFGVQ